MTTVKDRIWQYVDKTDNCWVWTGAKAYGYGKIFIAPGVSAGLAHRVMFTLQCPEVDISGLDLDHVCRNRACVNPTHLRPCSRQENLLAPGSQSLAKQYKDRSTCKSGHAYTAENTYLRRNGVRECRQCGAIRAAKYRQAEGC